MREVVGRVAAARPSGVAVCFLHAVRERGPRTDRRRGAARRVARDVRRRVARDLARDPRVRAGHDDGRVRGRRPGDGRLPRRPADAADRARHHLPGRDHGIERRRDVGGARRRASPC